MVSKYDEKSIDVLSSVEGIRRRASMYIGATDENGIFHLIKEAIDNTADEFIANRNKSAGIVFAKDGSYWIYDNGTGIPTGIHPKTKISTLTSIFTITHAGGKFGSDAYKNSKGVHGVGITCVNALSKSLNVWTNYKGWEHQAFSQGIPKAKISKSKAPKIPGNVRAKGTVIQFVPDKTIFEKSAFSEEGNDSIVEATHALCEMSAYVLGGFRIDVYDERTNEKTEWFFKNGLIDYLDDRVKKLKLTQKKIDSQYQLKTEEFELALAFTPTVPKISEVEFYVNSSPTENGGTHARAFKDAIFEAIWQFTKRDHEFEARDCSGFYGLLNFKVNEPSFTSQTKGNLNDIRGKDIEDTIYDSLFKFFKKNRKLAQVLVEIANTNYRNRTDNRFTSELVKEMKEAKKSKTLLPGKLVMAPHCKPKERSIWLVEGESASGPATQARTDIRCQEILALKGKPLNAARADRAKVYASEEIFNILLAIGFDPSAKDPYSQLRVGNRIVLLGDGDVDGPLHGSTRILTPDGKNPSIKSLYKKGEAVEIIARNDLNKMVKATATISPKVTKKTRAIRLHLDNGYYIESTRSHKHMTISGQMKRAKDFKTGDALEWVHRNTETKSFRNPISLYCVQKVEDVTYDKPEKYYCLTVKDHGNFAVADKDGNGIFTSNSHINLLLLTAIAVVLPKLFDEGRVYIASTPEFVIEQDGKRWYAKTIEKLKDIAPSKYHSKIQHLKGWGEGSPALLRDVAFNEDTALLQRVKKPNAKMMEKFLRLMSDDIEMKRKLLRIV